MGWTLDPDVTFLNHGSFGACPSPVLAEQARLRARLEAEPVRFFLREWEALLDGARAKLAAFLGAAPDDLVFVTNATTGASTVLRSLEPSLAPGDELVTTDHAYNACRNALDGAAERSGARVVVARVPFPVGGDDEVMDAVLAAVGPRTRLALLDHVTSPTGLVLPIARLIGALAERGIDTLVDGAHAPGMVDLDLDALGAAYYTGNCHKWLCAPKAVAFLHVRRDRQERVRPLVTSHGANTPRAGRSRFHTEFDWTGTSDPTAALCVPAAIDFMAARLPGGWPAVRAHNHALVLDGRRIVADALGVALPCPDAMVGSLAALPLPARLVVEGAGAIDPLQERLWERHRIEVPVIPWPRGSGARLLRVSAQLYNCVEDYRRLGAALTS